MLIVGLLVIAGCGFNDPIPNVQTLKQYHEHKPGEENDWPLASAARAKILSIRLCKDVKLPEGVSNDCAIFGGDMITLQDVDDPKFIKEYSFSFGQIPYYLADVLQSGDSCQFNFDAYVDGKIEGVNYCGNISPEQIEQAKKDWEDKGVALSTILGEGDVKEYGDNEVKIVKINDNGGIVISIDGGNYLTIKEGSELVDKNCLRIKNEWTEDRPMGKVAAVIIEKANLCDDVIYDIGDNCPVGVIC